MKLLLLDIETAPNTAFVWGLFKETIPLQRLLETGYVLCWSAKWAGSKEIYFDSVKKSGPKKMLKGIHGLLSEADAVIHYNGTSFDIPTLNREFLIKGLPPPAPYKQIDLLRTVRRNFRFTSNKLDHVAQQLGVGKKRGNEDGFELWIKCMNGDPEAWAKMETYNKNDVVLLEGVYEKLLPWIKTHPNHGIVNDQEGVCPNCGSDHLLLRGFAYTSSGKYQRYKCKDCGTWSRSRKTQAVKQTLTST